MRSLLFVACAALLAGPAMAQQMNAETFHKRAVALKKKGPMALFSRSEIKALMGEVQAAGKAANADRQAALKAGRKARYCPPSESLKMNSDEYMKRLADIPQAERRRIDMTEATTRIFAARHPC